MSSDLTTRDQLPVGRRQATSNSSLGLQQLAVEGRAIDGECMVQRTSARSKFLSSRFTSDSGTEVAHCLAVQIRRATDLQYGAQHASGSSLHHPPDHPDQSAARQATYNGRPLANNADQEPVSLRESRLTRTMTTAANTREQAIRQSGWMTLLGGKLTTTCMYVHRSDRSRCTFCCDKDALHTQTERSQGQQDSVKASGQSASWRKLTFKIALTFANEVEARLAKPRAIASRHGHEIRSGVRGGRGT